MPIVRFTKFALIDRITLLNIVKRVKKTYCSMDPLHISVLVCAEKFSDFVDVVLIVVNASVVSCKFPSSEKNAIILPSLKRLLDYQKLESYRPVSNLTYLSKLIESFMLDQIVAHLVLVQALPDSQSAYRHLYSTETAI